MGRHVLQVDRYHWRTAATIRYGVVVHFDRSRPQLNGATRLLLAFECC